MAVMTDNGDKGFLRGITITLTVMIGIMALWAGYTQTNRFTWDDGLRHEKRMEGLEDKNVRIEDRYDNIMSRLTRIEVLLQYMKSNGNDGY